MTTQSGILRLGNLMDRIAWQTITHRVTQSRVQLNRLSTHSRRRLTVPCHLPWGSSHGNCQNLRMVLHRVKRTWQVRWLKDLEMTLPLWRGPGCPVMGEMCLQSRR